MGDVYSVLDRVVKDHESGCWDWTGSIDRDGYGRINPINGIVLVHRLVYETFCGVTKGRMIRRTCENSQCCNPVHMAPSYCRPTENGIPAERFLEKLSKDTVRGCWLWTARINAPDTNPTGGYGMFWDGRNSVRSHCYSYELFCGPIPPGLVVCHHCDVRRCCNPTHLFLGSRGDNNRDAARKGRTAKGEGSGRAVFTDENVREIRTLHRTGKWGYGKLSKRFGVSKSAILNVVRGISWKHVTQES